MTEEIQITKFEMNKRLVHTKLLLGIVIFGCSDNMYNFAKEGITGEVRGNYLNNIYGNDPDNNNGEFTVRIMKDGITHWFNLADLIIIALKARV